MPEQNEDRKRFESIATEFARTIAWHKVVEVKGVLDTAAADVIAKTACNLAEAVMREFVRSRTADQER
jgi:hypothetical protein